MIIQIGETDKFIDCIEAITNNEQRDGLLNTSRLDPNTGMLFVYEEDLVLCFWMPPEMLFAIDIVFINESRKVVEVFENCEPGEQDPNTGQLMRFGACAKWVLEVGAGECRRLGIMPGVVIHFDDDESPGVE